MMNNSRSNHEIDNEIDALTNDSQSHPPIVFYGISIKRLVCLSILTLGFYINYWFYKNWKLIKQAGVDDDISPFWRSVFSIFFCHSMFMYIKESVERYSKKRSFSATWSSLWYIIFHVINYW